LGRLTLSAHNHSRNPLSDDDVCFEMPVLRLVLSISLVVSLVAVAAPAAHARITDTFLDDDTSRYEPYIERAVAEGLVSGCNPPSDDRFCPDQTMTRADFAVMLATAVDVDSKGRTRFRDMRKHLAESAVKGLDEAGVRVGCGRQRFCPDQPIDRGAMAGLIAGGLGWDVGKARHVYRDLDDHRHGAALAILARRGAVVPCDAPVSRKLCPDREVTRAEAVFALVVALDLDPARAPTHKSRSPSPEFADNFKGLKLWDSRNPSSRNRVTLTDTGYSGSGLRVNIARGSHFGADFRLDLSEEVARDPERLFFRYFLRLDPDWATHSSGKLPGFSGIYTGTGKGGYPSSPSSPGWSARIKFSATADDDPRAALGYYVYHLGQEGRYGDGMGWNEAGRLVPGEWYCLEGEVQINTPGLSDGVLRAWVDETAAFEGTGLQFRRPGEPGIAIESFWFNVYYGGPAVAQRDLGLTVDSVRVDNARIGCEAGSGMEREVTGDVSKDGFEDILGWGSCPGGTCFTVRTPGPEGARETWRPGDGAWLSLDTHRIGMAAGDVDGDGADDLVYPGRCRGSDHCWRVHPSIGGAVGVGSRWGDGARLSSAARGLVMGDWNGDGLDDLAYQGLCGRDGRGCWRVHLSDGKSFSPAADWGQSPGTTVMPLDADLDGDGRDDLVYPASCDLGTCWFGRTSTGDGFSGPVNLGKVRSAEREWSRFVDFDGDRKSDLISSAADDRGSRIDVRLMGDLRLAAPTTVVESRARILEVVVKPASRDRAAEALVTTRCKGTTCVEHLYSWASRLVRPSVRDSVEAMSDKLQRVEKTLQPTLPDQDRYRYERLETPLRYEKSWETARRICDLGPNYCV